MSDSLPWHSSTDYITYCVHDEIDRDKNSLHFSNEAGGMFMSFLEYFVLLQIMGVTGASCNTSKYITPSRTTSRTCCSTDGHRYDCGINSVFHVLRQPSTFAAWVRLDKITISLTEISRHDNYKMFTFDIT